MFGLQFGDLIIIGIGIVILLVWLFLFLKGKKDADLFMPLNDEDYPLKDLYFVGYAFAELIHMNYQTERDTEMRKQLTVLYGSEYVDFYIRAVYAQRFTMAFTLACFAMPLYCLTIGSGLAFVMIIGVAGFAYYYYGKTLPDKIEKRKKEMIAEFSEVVSKLALMVNSGMILHDAWKTVAYSGTAEIYKEMQFSVEGNLRIRATLHGPGNQKFCDDVDSGNHTGERRTGCGSEAAEQRGVDDSTAVG